MCLYKKADGIHRTTDYNDREYNGLRQDTPINKIGKIGKTQTFGSKKIRAS